MDKSKQDLANVWLRNQLANEQILEEVNEQIDLPEKVKRKIYLEFIHLHTIRYYNIQKQDKAQLGEIVKLSGKDKVDISLLKEHLRLSSQAIADIVKNKEDFHKAKSYKNGMIGWVVYLINHEAHHRSKAIMIMEEAGVKFSNRLKFSIWDWK